MKQVIWQLKGAGVPYGAGNKTEWPLEGGSVVLDLHHPWTYLYINLGLGENATNFNISLTPELLNVTGSGNFCIPALPVPATVTDGQAASLQVVTNGESGSALYNVSRAPCCQGWGHINVQQCADIVFKSSAKALSGGICTNSTGVTATIVGQAATTDSGSTPTPTPNNAPAMVFGGTPAVVLGLAVAFVLVM